MQTKFSMKFSENSSILAKRGSPYFFARLAVQCTECMLFGFEFFAHRLDGCTKQATLNIEYRILTIQYWIGNVSISNIDCLIFYIEYWILNIMYRILNIYSEYFNIHHWINNIEYWIVNVSISNIEYWILKSEYFNIEYWVLNIEKWIFQY